MNAEVSPRLPYNGSMLEWAREWRGRSPESAAARVNVPVEKLLSWEAGTDVPTVRQARCLAEYYDRAFMEFFYEAKPNIHESKLIPDYRLNGDHQSREDRREILAIQHWAEAQRINALSLFEAVGDPVPPFPEHLFSAFGADVDMAATAARKEIGFTIERQMHMKARERDALPALLREFFESLGVLVLRHNQLSEYGVSGMCVAEFPLPLIVYAQESPARTSFTLLHEFAHILLRESAISGRDDVREPKTHERKVEKWCNKFAAAFLIPKEEMERLRPPPEKPAPAIDDQILAGLAKTFRVSPHAMLIRLVDLQYVEADYYWNVKRPLFLAYEAAFKKGGRSKVWVSRVVNSLGRLYTGLVLEAWGTGKIQYHQAADFMGLKDPRHLAHVGEV